MRGAIVFHELISRGRLCCIAVAALVTAWTASISQADPANSPGVAFFEKKIRPILVARCYECHSHRAGKLAGGLAIDSKAGWSAGGEGGAVIVPGQPGESRLIQAVQWRDDDLRMPPKQKLNDAEVALLTEWVRMGAADPRESPPPATVANAGSAWEETFRERLQWWSLQSVADPRVPSVKRIAWPHNPIDSFILSTLEARGLSPAPRADSATLARRLSFALTGLPPNPDDVRTCAGDASPQTYDLLVDRLLASPHFGERWARRWMDVVHYADTHGYEWDLPAKNAWRYRDYLVRAFNADVPYRQLVLEHLAGDLLKLPRIDGRSGVNESLIGPMSLRLGERRHGDNGEFDGITQEAIDNVIDTVGKTFLATTVACAHCHDHKLDAIAQRDYFAWAGTFMSSRWVTRSISAVDADQPAIEDLRGAKQRLRPLLADLWLKAAEGFAPAIESFLSGASPNEKPNAWQILLGRNSISGENPAHVLLRLRPAVVAHADLMAAWRTLGGEYAQIGRARADDNRKSSRLIADFTKGKCPPGWSLDGLGARTGFARDGDFIVTDEGATAVGQLVSAGLYTHLYSPRLAGAVRSPMWADGPGVLSFELVGGGFASARPIFDHALFPEQATFLNAAFPSWTVAATRVAEATKQRRIYYELVTQGLNNNFPARVGLIRGSAAALADERSWFGLTCVYAGAPPQDDLHRFLSLFESQTPKSPKEAALRYADWLRLAIDHWRDDRADADDVRLINWMLQNKLLPNDAAAPRLAVEVRRYRQLLSTIDPDLTVGSIADLNEGRDERIAVRGSYTDFGEPAARGNIRFLSSISSKPSARGSGRLQLAQAFTDSRNPLTARVYVNRVWQALFGEGLVRTVDDFGHLGEKPSHPDLLDFLARRFMDEGWSTKKLVRLIVTSATWRQSGTATAAAHADDPENRLLHHVPLRRLEAEEIRDAVLAVSGRLDQVCYGPSIDPHRHSEDDMKRLVSGPVDGNGRRSVYIKVTLMEPPKFLAEFNQPLPKLTAGRRDVTNVPNQALTLLNDPFLTNQSAYWARRLVATDCATDSGGRIDAMLEQALGRPVEQDERRRLEEFAKQIATLRGEKSGDLMQSVAVWQDVAHTLFNLKEFLYVR